MTNKSLNPYTQGNLCVTTEKFACLCLLLFYSQSMENGINLDVLNRWMGGKVIIHKMKSH